MLQRELGYVKKALQIIGGAIDILQPKHDGNDNDNDNGNGNGAGQSKSRMSFENDTAEFIGTMNSFGNNDTAEPKQSVDPLKTRREQILVHFPLERSNTLDQNEGEQGSVQPPVQWWGGAG